MKKTANSRIVKPGRNNTLIAENGEILHPPAGWAFFPAGDAGITRKITAAGTFWRVQIKKGRRTISQGVWAPVETIEQAKTVVAQTRSTDTYKKKLASAQKSRLKKQAAYEIEFLAAVNNFLSFNDRHQELQKKLAEAVTLHAVPVGSGTVARTEMIPIEERAAKAVIAWMRHKTTAYDSMTIPLVKGLRRETRRMLARHSAMILDSYRKGDDAPENCPLQKAIIK